MSGRVIVMQGDAAHLPLPDGSVDLIVTSPPYFGQRDYRDGGESLKGQIGNEATPREYVDALLACTREWMRVLKPEGSLFVNLGDSYYSGKGAPGRTTTDPKNAGRNARRTTRSPLDYGLDLPRKSLVGTPWRYALGCIDDLGLTLRAEIVWAKPNGLPESVTDRVRRSHEQVFHFTRQPRYYAAVDEIRESYSDNPRAAWNRANGFAQNTAHASDAHNSTIRGRDGKRDAYENPLGKLPGSVWEIPSQPLTVPDWLGVDHFAAFPMELPRRIILGWSPPGICVACGEGRRPVSEAAVDPQARGWRAKQAGTRQMGGVASSSLGHFAAAHERAITGYACACPDATAPTRPAIVVDPFGGTGTTTLVASVLGRDGVTVDMSADYCRLAQWRTHDPAERCRVIGAPKPPPVADGQGDLFDLGKAS